MAIDPRRIEVIDDLTVEIMRRMTPVERVKRGLGMAAFARQVIESNVRKMHPEWDDASVRREVVRRFAGE